jgi:hypothetical protein
MSKTPNFDKFSFSTPTGLSKVNHGVLLEIKPKSGIIFYLPVVSFTTSYATNQIPLASVQIPVANRKVGYEDEDLKNNDTNIKRLIEASANADSGSPDVSIIMRLPGTDKGYTLNSDGKLLTSATLFTGKLLGYNYRSKNDKLYVVFNLVNSLVGLTYSSAAVGTVFPDTPAGLLFSGAAPGVGNQPSAIISAAIQALIVLLRKIPSDFGGAIIDVFKELANKTIGRPLNLSDSEVSKNNFAIDAIDGAKFSRWEGLQSQAGKLNLNSAIISSAARKISERFSESFIQSDFWTILIGRLLPEFGVHVIPLAERALIVPVLDIAKTASKHLDSNQIIDVDFTSSAVKPLKGVIVYGRFDANHTSAGTSNKEKEFAGAAFIPKQSGLLQYIPQPWWGSRFAIEPTVNQGKPLDSSVSNPTKTNGSQNQSTVENPEDAGNGSLENTREAINDVMSKYAKFVYRLLALQNRTGYVLTNLRFDICPGMTISFENANVESDFNIMYGLVNQVTISIDADSQIAMTKIDLVNVRTKFENELKSESADNEFVFSSDEHPFFSDYFKGASIVPELDSKF